nr:MAG TPA_asm: replisome organizer [Bacteriophage sp.]
MMTRDDVKKILMMMSAAYPNFKPQDKTVTINTWYMMLSEYSYQQAETALRMYIASDESGFAPSIGQLIAKMKIADTPQQLNEMEAWSLVSKAIRNGYYGAVEEFLKLPPLVQRAVGTADNLRNWSQTDLDSIETVVQSNFLRAYRVEAQRAAEISKMPSDVKTMIEDTFQNSYSAQIANKNKCSVKSLLEDKKTKYGQNNDITVPMPNDWRERLDKGWN